MAAKRIFCIFSCLFLSSHSFAAVSDLMITYQINSCFKQGQLRETGNDFDFGISGDGCSVARQKRFELYEIWNSWR